MSTKKLLVGALAMVLALVLVMAAGSVYYVQTIGGLVRQTTSTTVMELSVAKAQNLDERFDACLDAVRLLAHSVEQCATAEQAQTEVLEFLESHDASTAWLKDTRGHTWCSDARANQYPEARQDALFGPALQGESGSSDVFIGHLGSKRIMFYAPLTRDGEVAGAVYVSFRTETLQDVYGNSTYSDEGFSYVIDSRGDVVLSANQFSLLQSYSSFERLLLEAGNRKADVEAFLAAVASGHSGTAVLTFEDQQQFLAFVPLQAKPDWHFVTVIPLDVVEKDGTAIVRLTTQIALVFMAAIVVAVAVIVGLVIARNRQERRMLLQAATLAEEANRSKSTFLSSMSHDIRTPMNAIVGFATLLERDAENPEAVRSYTQKIITSSNHLLGLINDVLDMSKIESGKTTLNSQPFVLQDVLDAVEAMMRPQTEEKGQSFVVETAGVDDLVLVGDEGRLRQILTNLLSNATKYTPEKGHIWLRVNAAASSQEGMQPLRIVVQDDGIGMAEEYQSHIFDLFSREESSLTNKIQGTGIGMAITKNLVELMGGAIGVESTVGEGSTFTVDLNLAVGEPVDKALPAKGSRSEQRRTDEKPFEGLHFLVAEDNDLNREIVEALLEMQGATCEIAVDGRDAVELFSASQPGHFDMVFMDVQMPVMNGYEAVRAIRALDRADARAIPVVAMTANAFVEDVREAEEAGMDGHVAKPIDIGHLKETVARLLGKR